MRVLPGRPFPLGASWDGHGVNFAIYSENATAVELCLVDKAGHETRIPIRERTGFTWHGYVAGLKPGQAYGYRVSGPWDPDRGMRFNPNVLLLDPYAKALDGPERWDDGVFGHDAISGDDRGQNPKDARGAPRGVVIDTWFDWGSDARPDIPFHKSVFYE